MSSSTGHKFCVSYKSFLNPEITPLTDDKGDLELLNAKADRDQGGGTPYEAVLLDGSDTFFQELHVRFVVPRLDVKSNDGLDVNVVIKYSTLGN